MVRFPLQSKMVGCAMLAATAAARPGLASAHCPGEIDWAVLDGRVQVNVFDFTILAANFGSAVPPGTLGDLDGNGFVNVFDFALFAGSFGCEAQLEEPAYVETTSIPLDWGIVTEHWSGVNGAAGEAVHECVDLRIAGRGYDFVWARRYRSRLGPDTAQGVGWDFSYNIFVEQGPGTDLILRDGGARADTYEDQGGGVWHDEEFFRELTINPGPNTYTLRFRHGDRWEFNALDGSPAEGRIAAIVDRNGNTMSFDYDASGRLVTIHDTLDNPPLNPREITVAYDAGGRIASVTDFIGRQVTYEYYTDPDVGGDDGDLRSATSPPVVGTPTGNDYPLGKTTVYAYSEGFDNDRLNHNLLTITDPRGNTYLTNEYASTLAPADLEHDRLVRVTLGDPGDVIDLVYTEVTPAPANNFACIKVTSNDRVGNVEEGFYDAGNRLVVRREYTGRANPDLPTDLDSAANPPGAPLRATDPAFFETRWEWNADSRLTRVVLPELDERLFAYDELNPERRSQGNLLTLTRLPGPRGGDQASIVELFEYDPIINNGTNFVTRHVDGRGNDTTHQYDAAGNRTHTTHRIPSIVEDWEYNGFGQVTKHVLPANGSGGAGCRRVDLFTYYPGTDVRFGYLESVVADATDPAACPGGHFDLTTTYEYDSIGRRTRVIDPRGNDALVEYNALDRVVRTLSREITTTVPPVRYERLTYYDANDNVVRVDVENRDETGVLQPNTHFTTVYEYEVLNYLTRSCGEKGGANLLPSDLDCGALPAGQFITTEYEYDDNRNLALLRTGEAVAGGQPANTVTTLYDERDLVFRTIRAQGDPEQSTSQMDYDGNRNVVRIDQGLEANGAPAYAGDASHTSIRGYDGYDRPSLRTDAMGNTLELHYDGNSNRVSLRIDGETPDVPGGAGNVRLHEESRTYDAMDRPTARNVQFFDTATQLPLTDGSRSIGITWPDFSIGADFTSSRPDLCLASHTDDNGNTTTISRDTANRIATIIDARANTLAYTYDANSNVVRADETDKSDLGNPDEVFVSQWVYDELDRPVQLIDPVGNTTALEYDSRGNMVRRVDARGNVVRGLYDGISRLTGVERDLTDTGDGAGLVTGTVTTGLTYDDNHRLTEFVDAGGNPTLRSYDALDRLVVEMRADGTARLASYDSHGNVSATMDPNLTSVSTGYDGLERPTNRAILVGPGVSVDTTFESFAFDGLSRLVSAQDDDSLATFVYDSTGNCTSQTLTIGGAPAHTTTSTYDGWGNRTLCVYPGGRQISCIYDPLNRVSQVKDGGATHATFAYIGQAGGVDFPKIFEGEPLRLRLEALDPGCDDKIINVQMDWNDSFAIPNDTDFSGFYNGVKWTDDCDPAPAPPPPLRPIVLPSIQLPLPHRYCQEGTYTPSISFTDSDGAAAQYTWTVQVTNFRPLVNIPRSERVERLTLANGTQSDVQYDGVANPPGDSGVKQIIGLTHSVTLGPILDDRIFRWDEMGNKTAHDDVTPGGQQLQHGHAYDSLDRLVETTLIDPATTGVVRRTSYALDGAGNRTSLAGASSSGVFVLDPTSPVPADAQVNQYTQTPRDGNAHDENGNLRQQQRAVTGDPFSLDFDYRDRLVRYQDIASGDVTTFAYDALGRRISKTFVPMAGPPLETRFYYDGKRVVEERNQLDIPTITYVRREGGLHAIAWRGSDTIRWSAFDRGCDDLTADVHNRFYERAWLERGRSILSMQTGGQDFFYHCDDLGSTRALTDGLGNVVERYEYSDYGEPRILTDRQPPDESLAQAIVSEADPAPFGSVEEAAENVLLGPSRLTTLRWWGVYTHAVPAEDRFNIRIYDDAGGVPGVLLHEELNVTQVGRALNGLSIGVLDEYVYLYTLARPFEPPVPGAQYWVSIQNDTSVDPATAWAWTVGSTGDGQIAVNSNFAGFTIEAFNLGFELFTDESSVENPILFRSLRYDLEPGLYFSPRDFSFMYPFSGRLITRQGMDNLGNDYTFAADNPTSRPVAPDPIRRIEGTPDWSTLSMPDNDRNRVRVNVYDGSGGRGVGAGLAPLPPIELDPGGWPLRFWGFDDTPALPAPFPTPLQPVALPAGSGGGFSPAFTPPILITGGARIFSIYAGS